MPDNNVDPLNIMPALNSAQGGGTQQQAMANVLGVPASTVPAAFQPQPEQPQPQKQGRLKSLLMNMAQGAAIAGGYAAGIPQSQELQAQTAEANARVPLIKAQTKMMTDMVDTPFGQMSASTWKAIAPAIVRGEYSKQNTQANINSREKLAELHEGIQLPVPQDIATEAGLPELAGQKLGKSGWGTINAALGALGKDLVITDVGSKRVLMRKSTGDVVRELGEAPGYTSGMAKMNALGPRLTSVMYNGVATPLPNALLAQMANKGIFLETAANSPELAATKAQAIAFTSGTESDQKQSFRAFAGHVNDLSDYSSQFSRTNSRWANKPLNELRANAGDNPDIAAFLAKIDPVQKEFETFLLNNRALYESDRATAAKILSGDMPINQMNSALNSFMHTAAIRMGSLNQKYRDAHNGKDDPTLLDPETTRILQKFGQLKTVQKYTSGSSANGSGVIVVNPEDMK